MASWVIHTTISCPSLSLSQTEILWLYAGEQYQHQLAHLQLVTYCLKTLKDFFLHRNLCEQGIYTYPLHRHSGSRAYMFPAKQWNRNKKPQPTYVSVSWHAEFCLTSCEHGRLPSHVLQNAEVAGIVKKANYSIMERRHLSGRGVQVYNHHTEGESAVIVNGNTLRYFHQRCFLHWKWKHENSPGQDPKSCTCSLISVFDVIHI